MDHFGGAHVEQLHKRLLIDMRHEMIGPEFEFASNRVDVGELA